LELSADIRNVRFTDADVRATGQDLGGVGVLAGGSGAYVFNVSVVGGLLGRSDGIVSNCSSSVTVSGNSGTPTGGLVGHNVVDGVVEQSYSTGSVSIGSAVGGLVGKTEGGGISDSYSMAAVTGSDGGSAGGLIGSYATGSSAPPTLNASYSTGTVSGGASTGGLIGQDLVGSGIANAYWDLDTSSISDPSKGAGNIANDPGITGLGDSQLMSGLPSGFSIDVWREKSKTNAGLPYLITNPSPK
jgi:The GLUG motif